MAPSQTCNKVDRFTCAHLHSFVCGVGQPVHAQRVLEYSKLDLDFLVKISYDRIMTWRPVSSYGLSQEKFVKVMREAKLFEGKKSKQMNQIETIFIKEVRKGTHAVGEKHVNQDGWKALLIEAAATRFPVTTGKQAAAAMDSPEVQTDLLQHILHNYICMVPDITEYVPRQNLRADILDKMCSSVMLCCCRQSHLGALQAAGDTVGRQAVLRRRLHPGQCPPWNTCGQLRW